MMEAKRDSNKSHKARVATSPQKQNTRLLVLQGAQQRCDPEQLLAVRLCSQAFPIHTG